jgi:hypothetical protein
MSSNAKNGRVTVSSNGKIAVGERYSVCQDRVTVYSPPSNACQVTPEVTLWRYAGLEPYQRKDGNWTHLKVWTRPCRICGEEFTIKTPQGAMLENWTGSGGSNKFSLVTCQEHRGLARPSRSLAQVPA